MAVCVAVPALESTQVRLHCGLRRDYHFEVGVFVLLLVVAGVGKDPLVGVACPVSHLAIYELRGDLSAYDRDAFAALRAWARCLGSLTLRARLKAVTNKQGRHAPP